MRDSEHIWLDNKPIHKQFLRQVLESHSTFTALQNKSAAQLLQLTTELEALRRDKERLDKMEELFLSVSWNKRSQVWIVQQMNQVVGNIGANHTMRQAMDTAIDAEMKKETK